jgi:CubicO group peptidase (beta-lactamase class C family)
LPATGTVTARAMARMLAALIGEVDGVRLVSPERLREATAPIARGPDWVFGQEMPGSMGYAVEADGVFGASGIGGSVAYASPRLGLTAAALKNNLAFGDEDPMEELWSLIVSFVGGRS